MKRREYQIAVFINEVFVSRVIIDPHYEEKHWASIDDGLILKLVASLHGRLYEPVCKKGPYSYFVLRGIDLGGKRYKLVWLLEDSEVYLGVINAHRES